jgi:uncharacterized protein YwqG
MSAGHDRRRFFKELLRGAAEVAQEVNSAMRFGLEPQVEEPEPWQAPPPRKAPPARALVSGERLRELCLEVGLEARADDVLRLARRSVRLTPGGPDARSRLGGSPDVPAGFEWPTWEGRELGFLGQIDLAEAAASGCASALPAAGRLLAFYDLGTLPSGLDPSHRGSCRVVLLGADAPLEPAGPRTPGLRELPLELSCELTLPGPWSFPVEPLELEPDEASAWDDLRTRLAAEQGVELEESIDEWFALHRLLGHHEELGREVELDCELAAAGIDADDYETYFERREQHEAPARDWRLLLQISSDDDLAPPWDSFGRLYVCIREDDLRGANLDAAWALLR